MMFCRNGENCQTCVGRADVAQRLPNSVFRPHSLKQQIVLQLANQFYPEFDNSQSAIRFIRLHLQQLGLPNTVIADIDQVMLEMDKWAVLFGYILGQRQYACYMPALHWHSHRIGVNWRKTGEMIVENAEITRSNHEEGEWPGECPADEILFQVAASSFLEQKVETLWSNLAVGTKDRLRQILMYPHTDIQLSYWVAKCLDRDPNRYLKAILEGSIRSKLQDVLEYFWPVATAAATDDSSLFSYLYGHSLHLTLHHSFYDAFHEAMSCGNKTAAVFLCVRATPLQLVSMRSFEHAVAYGHIDLARYIWQAMMKEEGQHCKSFCLAVAEGAMEIVETIWSETSEAQRAEMLEQSASAFRKAAGKGHLQIIKFLWSAANENQRRQFLGDAQDLCDALRWAAARGAKDILVYLCSEMNDEAKDCFFSKGLARCILAGLNSGRPDTVDFLLTLPRDQAEFRRVVWSDGGHLFWNAFKQAKAGADWRPVHIMFSVLNKDEAKTVFDKFEPDKLDANLAVLMNNLELLRSHSLSVDCPTEIIQVAMEESCHVPSREEENLEVDEG